MTTVPHNTVMEKVVRHELCCCCGLCAAVCPQQRLVIQETEYGEFFPFVEKNVNTPKKTCDDLCRLCLSVCPCVPGIKTENVPWAELLDSDGETFRHDDVLGAYHQTYVGAVSRDSERLKAPSGGFATALLCRLLEKKQIDAAIVASPTTERPWFERRVATTMEEVLQSRGSVYHVLKNDDVLREIIDGPECCYAVVALPCMAKAIRLAQQRFPKLKRRIRYVLGLTCGGCNTLHMPDLLTVMLGEQHAELCYRSKRNAKNARDYSVALPDQPERPSVRMLGLFGFLWINHIGMLSSCLYCNDVFAKWADVTLMDAWLPEYIPDARGTSLAISRNTEVSEQFDAMLSDGTFQGGIISPERIRESQESVTEERQRYHRVFSELAGLSTGHSNTATCSKKELCWGKRFLACHRNMRKLLRYYSHKLAQHPNWYSRVYIVRLFWLTFLSLVRHRLLKKTIQSLHFLKKK